MMSVEFYSSVVKRVQEPEARQLLEKILQQQFNSIQELIELLERYRSKRPSGTTTE